MLRRSVAVRHRCLERCPALYRRQPAAEQWARAADQPGVVRASAPALARMECGCRRPAGGRAAGLYQRRAAGVGHHAGDVRVELPAHTGDPRRVERCRPAQQHDARAGSGTRAGARWRNDPALAAAGLSVLPECHKLVARRASGRLALSGAGFRRGVGHRQLWLSGDAPPAADRGGGRLRPADDRPDPGATRPVASARRTHGTAGGAGAVRHDRRGAAARRDRRAGRSRHRRERRCPHAGPRDRHDDRIGDRA